MLTLILIKIAMMWWKKNANTQLLPIWVKHNYD